MIKKWYVLQVYTGKEQFVERGIRTLVNDPKYSSVILDVRSPIEEFSEVRNGRKRVSKRNVLPGYVLVQMELPDSDWHKFVMRIVSMQFVSAFVGTPYGAKPNPVTTDEARKFLILSGEKKLQGTMKVVFFAEGDSVRVIDGPFKSFIGRVDEVVEDRQKLRVMVGIFGRSTPVEVDYKQVEKV